MSENFIEDLINFVPGDSLVSAWYLPLEGEGWPCGHEHGGLFHEVDVAICLVFSSGKTLYFTWVVDGLNEALALNLRDDFPSVQQRSDDYINVTEAFGWRGFIGRSVNQSSVARHVPNEGCSEVPWAVRLGFAGGKSVVIALGEIVEGRISYIPDALLVIFDMDAARGYRVPSSVCSAYGDAD
ncbi:hypothetical protein [Nocardiopsis gilva]|uniref:hypothetical protein n=1 Tax=Nocardiopsis gilva TaxID=280236 RepID=UPI0012681E2B|nr:hypothetical protein [Nocardiopsis gilva]